MLTGIREKVVIGVSSALLTTAVLWGLSKAGVFVETLLVPDLPGGAVVAFDGDCPSDLGWVPFDDGAGKILLGAGQGTLVATGPHNGDRDPGQEVPLTAAAAGAQGGFETHVLTINEMPSHSHNAGRLSIGAEDQFDFLHQTEAGIATNNGGSSIGALFGDENVARADFGKHDHIITGSTEEAGGKVAHNNMPPYIALSFCKKATN